MANAPDSLAVTGPNFQQINLGSALVTPAGGTQTTLDRLVIGGTIAQTLATSSVLPSPIISGIPSESITNAVTASATQTLAGATALTKAWNVISTVATAGNAVKLPPVVVNSGFAQVCWVINNGASLTQIFPFETATAIDSAATAAAVTLTTLHRAAFVQNTASTWVSVASVSAAS